MVSTRNTELQQFKLTDIASWSLILGISGAVCAILAGYTIYKVFFSESSEEAEESAPLANPLKTFANKKASGNGKHKRLTDEEYDEFAKHRAKLNYRGGR